MAAASSSGATRYLFNIPYGVGKAGLDRLTADMAHELQAHNIAVVSIWPGLTRTEIVMAHAERGKTRGRALKAVRQADPIRNGARLAADRGTGADPERGLVARSLVNAGPARSALTR